MWLQGVRLHSVLSSVGMFNPVVKISVVNYKWYNDLLTILVTFNCSRYIRAVLYCCTCYSVIHIAVQ